MDRKKIIGHVLGVDKLFTFYTLLFTAFVFLTLLFTLHTSQSLSWAADKLVVKDVGGNIQFVVKEDGKVGAGTANPVSQFSVSASPGDAFRGFATEQFSTNRWGAQMEFIKARGTEAAPQSVTSGDYIGFFDAKAFDGVSYCSGNGHFGFIVDGAVSPGIIPLAFYITTGSLMDWNDTGRDFYISSSGKVGIGTTNPQGKLDINGAIYQRGVQLHADYLFEPDYKMESIEEHARYMWKNKHLKAVPKVRKDENGLEIIEIGTHQRGILEELEKAHVYIEQLNNRIKELETKINEIKIK
jgi:hypothetical protein